MATPFLGQITLFGGNFAPRGFALCSGQFLAIAQNDALFALIGTTYGGDGVTSFALPDMRGRLPVHAGQGPGLSNYIIGQSGGSETVTLAVTQIPSHTHTTSGSSASGSAADPSNGFWAAEPTADVAQFSNAAPGASMSPAAVSNSGGSQPHENLQPFLCVNFVIAIEGIFPSRN